MLSPINCPRSLSMTPQDDRYYKIRLFKKGSTNIRKLVSANTLYRGSPAVLEALYSERIEFRMYYYYMYYGSVQNLR